MALRSTAQQDRWVAEVLNKRSHEQEEADMWKQAVEDMLSAAAVDVLGMPRAEVGEVEEQGIVGEVVVPDECN